MNRIDAKFFSLRQSGKKALIGFITAGDPNLTKTQQYVLAFEKQGCDIIELGVPFSDPIADGPVIQQSTIRSLKNKTNLSKILSTVKSLRQKTQIPILLMTYLNPIYSYGFEKFAKQAKKCGVDGVIIPELPMEESDSLRHTLSKEGVHLVYLATPTSGKQRLRNIAKLSRGFIYFVSLTGVTGMRSKLSINFESSVRFLQSISKTPVCIGFGISNPDQAKRMSAIGDGVIIGSAIVSEIGKHARMPASRMAAKIIRPFSQSLHTKKT